MIDGILLCAWKECRSRLRDRWALVMWLVVPLTIGVMITSLAGGEGGPKPTASVLLVDEDQTFWSGALGAALGGQGASDLMDVTEVERADGLRQIDAGEATALLVVPKGFGDAVLAEEPVNLELITHPAQRILPGIVEEVLGVLVDGVFYLHRVFGDEIRTITGIVDQDDPETAELFDDPQIAQLSVAINHRIEELVDLVDPPVLDLAEPEAVDEEKGPDLNFALVFFPGTVFMALLFAAQGFSDVFWKERENGTLRRVVTSPLTTAEILVGKITAAAALLGALSGILVGLGMAWHGLGIVHWLPAAVWLALSGLMLFGLMSFFQLVAPTRKSASLITMLLVFPLMMMGGAFFPIEALPEWMGTVSHWVPNGYMLEKLKAFLIYGEGFEPMVRGLAFAVPVTFALWVLCAWRLRSFAGSG